MLKPASDYDALVSGFAWDIPERFNIGVDVCDRWAGIEPDRAAIHDVSSSGAVTTTTFGDLSEASNRLAHALVGLGLRPGDRVGVLLPQSAAVVVAHAAAYKLGAIALPLAGLFGPEALEYRLSDSGAAALVTDAAGLAKIEGIRHALPALAHLVCLDGAAEGVHAYADLIGSAPAGFTAIDSRADDPALMIYTSGTTGLAKGALHAHRVLLGHLPGFAMMHDFPPKSGDLMWTPSDWAWAGGVHIRAPDLGGKSCIMAKPGRWPR
ncbi:AMP-binding protein, partial [Methylobacterium bullatum]|uniref:AMP-binding protein n=1 Tax=Methylobacterium bullatum TaxID=570505 RepID=UPI003144F395